MKLLLASHLDQDSSIAEEILHLNGTFLLNKGWLNEQEGRPGQTVCPGRCCTPLFIVTGMKERGLLSPQHSGPTQHNALYDLCRADLLLSDGTLKSEKKVYLHYLVRACLLFCCLHAGWGNISLNSAAKSLLLSSRSLFLHFDSYVTSSAFNFWQTIWMLGRCVALCVCWMFWPIWLWLLIHSVIFIECVLTL